MGGRGELPELALARSDRFVAVLSAPLVEQPGYRSTTLPQVILVDIGLACMQASPDRAHGARVQIVARLEENRRKN